MSGIDRIGGGGAAQGPEEAGAARSDRASGPTRAFSERLAPKASVEGSSGQDESLVFPAVRESVLAGVAAGLDREGVLAKVVEGELTRAYGKDATPEMLRAVDRSFRANDTLWSLFNRLYDQAVASK